MEKIVNSTEETEQLAGEVAKKLKRGDVLALYGDLGAGKTTFTRFLVKALGFTGRVQSPTFVLARVYNLDLNNVSSSGSGSRINRINHLDLYRLQNKEEVGGLGIKEYFDQPDSLTVIEWPEVAEDYLPENTVKIIFEDLGDSKRKITILQPIQAEGEKK